MIASNIRKTRISLVTICYNIVERSLDEVVVRIRVFQVVTVVTVRGITLLIHAVMDV